MNRSILRFEYEALPYREDLVNEPLPGTYFRDQTRPGLIFQAMTDSHIDWMQWVWWCFRVDIEED